MHTYAHRYVYVLQKWFVIIIYVQMELMYALKLSKILTIFLILCRLLV